MRIQATSFNHDIMQVLDAIGGKGGGKDLGLVRLVFTLLGFAKLYSLSILAYHQGVCLDHAAVIPEDDKAQGQGDASKLDDALKAAKSFA